MTIRLSCCRTGSTGSVNQIICKGLNQDLAGQFQAKATGPQVEDGVHVHLAGCGPVGTLHLIGVDFELGLGVDAGIV